MKITPDEAKQITESARNIDINEIYHAIRRAAECGDDNITFVLQSKHRKFADEIVLKLKEEGFSAKRDTYSDYRDSWDNLVIEW